MKFKHLCKLVRAEGERTINREAAKPGHPLDGKTQAAKRDVVGRAIYDHIIANGPVVIGDMTIGVSPSCTVGSGLRATDMAEFNNLVQKLIDTELSDFVTRLTAAWKKHKMDTGVYSEREETAADRFSNQTFEGFT